MIEKPFKFHGEFLVFKPSKDFHFNFSYPQSSQTGSLLLSKKYSDKDFCKLIYKYIEQALIKHKNEYW